jgi:hypothetical protein
MSASHEPFADRRERLAAEITRQRSQLAYAYHNLQKPIHYAEYGLSSFGFLRKNTWVFAAAPAVFSIASTLFGLRKLKSSRPSPRRRQSMEAEARPKGLLGHAAKWGGHGLRLFRLYRRVRPFLFP